MISILIVVVLPAPFGPSSPKSSPGCERLEQRGASASARLADASGERVQAPRDVEDDGDSGVASLPTARTPSTPDIGVFVEGGEGCEAAGRGREPLGREDL